MCRSNSGNGQRDAAMDIAAIDWNEVWREKRKKRLASGRGPRHWDKRAPSFAEHAPKSDYARAFLEIMKPVRTWTVLDMACGPGTLALPLAQKVKSVTAVDFSDKMLAILEERLAESRTTNVRTLRARWEDDWDAAGIGLHDVVVASRSLNVDDLQAALSKLCRACRKRVYLSIIVGDGPFDRRIFAAIGKEFVPLPDYVYVYNLLYRMGIYANVSFISEKHDRTFENFEEALESVKWMTTEITPEQENKLASYLKAHLVSHDGKWRFDYDFRVRWAVIWWEK